MPKHKACLRHKQVVPVETSVKFFPINYKLTNFDTSEVEEQFRSGVRFQCK